VTVVKAALDSYDIVFIGHMCFDVVVPYHGAPHIAPGSAVLCGALVAARMGKKVAVVTRMALPDERILEPLRQSGVAVHVIPAPETTCMKVLHPSADVDDRQMVQQANAGFFLISDLPPLNAHFIHLAGITDREFTLDFIDHLKKNSGHLSVDMQSFVRQVDPLTHAIAFQDVLFKREIVRQMDMVKLDVIEARLLTGAADLEQAARTIAAWGCPEVVITQSEGVLAYVNGQVFYERFSNRSVVGRTGRGDTTFAAYLARRMDHDAAESLKFASALVSIKMETPGPFTGNLEDVFARMEQERSQHAPV
jgi:sugar/nucleoside kinase (ribokinase family)